MAFIFSIDRFLSPVMILQRLLELCIRKCLRKRKCFGSKTEWLENSVFEAYMVLVYSELLSVERLTSGRKWKNWSIIQISILLRGAQQLANVHMTTQRFTKRDLAQWLKWKAGCCIVLCLGQ